MRTGGHKLLDSLCKALGLPDDLPVYAVSIAAPVDGLPTVAVCFYPDEKYRPAVAAWLEANVDRVLVREAEADPSSAIYDRRGVRVYRKGEGC